MPKSAGQKLKLLYLMQILLDNSDEAHPLSVQDLIAALDRKGVAAERKSIYDDMEALEQFGLDIVTVRGRGNAYYIGERTFQLPELKLLVDVVQSSNFITEKKSGELIRKISSLTSVYESLLLRRQVYVTGRTKAINEEIYYNVDKIHSAISENKKIRFLYFEWVVDRSYPHLFDRRFRHGGAPYLISPWALTWDDENYYLIGFDSAAGIIKHYRVDKMSDIRVADEERDGQSHFERFDIARYTKMTFGMFSGEETDVRLRFHNRLIGVVVDRFGRDIMIHPSSGEHFALTVRVAVSPKFISWLFGFGSQVEVLAPDSVKDYLLAEMEKVKGLYK